LSFRSWMRDLWEDATYFTTERIDDARGLFAGGASRVGGFFSARDPRGYVSEKRRQQGAYKATRGALRSQIDAVRASPLDKELKRAQLANLRQQMRRTRATHPGSFHFRGLGARGANAVSTAPWKFWILILLTILVYHIPVIFGKPPLGARIMLNALMVLLMYLTLDEGTQNLNSLRTLLVIGVFESFYPLIFYYLPFLSQFSFVRVYLATGFFPLIWFYYALYTRGRGVPGVLPYLLKIGVVLFWSLIIIFTFLSFYVTPLNDIELSTIGTDPFYAFGEIMSRAKDGGSQLGGMVWNSVTTIWNVFDMQRKQVSSEYYAGVVDENEEIKLGLYIDDVTPTRPEFFRDEKVNIFASLETRTLEDSVDVEVSCYAGKKKKDGKNEHLIHGDVYPQDTFTIFDLQEEEIDCTFPETRLPPGTNKVTVGASYNFETIAYLKRFFVDRDALHAARREGIDLLSEYQVKERQSIARYTNGPVRIGIGPEEEVIGVSEDYLLKPRLGVTLDGNTQWSGHIKSIDEVILIIPEEMSLDFSSCTDPSFKSYTVEDCVAGHTRYRTRQDDECNGDAVCLEEICQEEIGGHNAYSLDTSQNPRLYSDLESFVTFSCRMNIDDIPALLGNTPLSPQFFYVKARYHYETEKTGAVFVKEETISGEIYEAPKTFFGVGGASDDNLMKEIYLQHYFSETHIQDAIGTHFPGLDPYLVLGVIAAKSKNNPGYAQRRSSGADERGLMHLTGAQVEQARTMMGMGHVDIFSPATNIAMGVRLLKYYDSLQSTGALINSSDDLLAAYYASEEVLEQDASCGDKKYKCAPEHDETRKYVDLVQHFMDVAKDLELVEQGQLESVSTGPYKTEGEITLTAFTPAAPEQTHSFTAESIPIEVVVKKTEPNTGNYAGSLGGYALTIYATLDGTKKKMDRFSFSTPADFTSWKFVDNLPFFQFKLVEEAGIVKKVQYRYLKSGVTNAPLIWENDGLRMDTSDRETVWAGFVDAGYDGGELQLSFDRGDKDVNFCEIQWGRYVVTQICDWRAATDVTGITARRISRTVGLENSLGRGNTQVQFVYDMPTQVASMVELL
jgi:hypothetical protein